jgi:hypothetical protein
MTTRTLRCPFCTATTGARGGTFTRPDSFRQHLVRNPCGLVPLDVRRSVFTAVSKMREDELQREVLHLAESNGWLVCHVRKGKVRDGGFLTTTSAAGFPDVVMMRAPQLVFLELKSQAGRSSPEQLEWIAGLQACAGVEAYVARPKDWPHIFDLLTAVHDHGTDGS